ncbi:pyrimidine 5'-nucleotidase [Shinella sp. AETb1-6]|jgi:putative hydrolase of the HAD superfamily|uniref:Pyrimidine 5'-nucleotidase n=2 Tax=Shinella TaxID=323620 RepID=A0AA50CLM4_9HYPH|nr:MULTISPECIES: pyrimidine 5'-nucleotidase [Shinella]MDP9592002.1 putative hydrolase of the HAD superfamily [Shinella zoogloeoides]MCD1264884.1 pyrimidine 5'-nucleotidase [Shinella sumterensis]MXN50452.1 pyrimidine 5'-nucleotidase [Shinella sp. AETb1-6]TFE99217.1 pyrimidine 5'-nucleotidase [Shinella sumterensis]WLR96729.1 pyrimidine 5'-nucleotidase [Shinella sumterensis]
MTDLPNKADFAHVRDWVFDLDNTLYPHHVDLFAQIDKNMTAYVSALLGLSREDARALQKQYYYDHGTTLKGLMIHHDIDPLDFLEKAHAIDYGVLSPDLSLGEAIRALPGRKFIFTNGSVKHAEMAAKALGILDHFDDVFDIVAAEYMPKPAGATYDKFMALHRIETQQAVMFEDLPRNLLVPKALGMKTVLLIPQNENHEFVDAWEKRSEEDEHIDYATSDLTAFLNALL